MTDQVELHDSLSAAEEDQEGDYTRSGSARKLGRIGELKVALLLVEKGYNLDVYGGSANGPDIVLEDRVLVDVKTALPSERYGRDKKLVWQFAINRYNTETSNHLVILRCQAGIEADDPVWHFVIPADRLKDVKKLDITSRPDLYDGRWRSYLGAWRHLVPLLEEALATGWPRYEHSKPIPW